MHCSPRCSPIGAPALPLDEAGKYVAGAFIVFMVLLVVYVAIMAAKLQRIERELRELASFAESRAKGEEAAPDARVRRHPYLILWRLTEAEEAASYD